MKFHLSLFLTLINKFLRLFFSAKNVVDVVVVVIVVVDVDVVIVGVVVDVVVTVDARTGILGTCL